MPNANELKVVEFHDGIRDEGLSGRQASAYAQYDKCKICTVFGAGSARDARQVAEAILESGIDTDLCIKGSEGISCPYGDTRPAVIEALKSLIKISAS